MRPLRLVSLSSDNCTVVQSANATDANGTTAGWVVSRNPAAGIVVVLSLTFNSSGAQSVTAVDATTGFGFHATPPLSLYALVIAARRSLHPLCVLGTHSLRVADAGMAR